MTSIDGTELYSGSTCEEMDSVETLVKPASRSFTIESLIGNKGEVSNRNDDIEKGEDQFERKREFLYQQHCLATTTSTLPGLSFFYHEIFSESKLTLIFNENISNGLTTEISKFSKKIFEN